MALTDRHRLILDSVQRDLSLTDARQRLKKSGYRFIRDSEYYKLKRKYQGKKYRGFTTKQGQYLSKGIVPKIVAIGKEKPQQLYSAVIIEYRVWFYPDKSIEEYWTMRLNFPERLNKREAEKWYKNVGENSVGLILQTSCNSYEEHEIELYYFI